MQKNRNKRVVLIQPHCSFSLKGASVFNTEFDSIGLIALSSFLRIRGYHVEIINFARGLATGLTPDALFSRVEDDTPLLVGISINWLHLSQGAIEIAAALKSGKPKLPVILGGQHASFFAEDVLREHSDIIDGVVVGEGEETLLEILEHITDGAALEGIPGLMTWDGSESHYKSRKVTLALEDLPFLSYDHIFPKSEQRPGSLVGAVDTCRGGCFKNCNYCLESCSLGTFGRSARVHHTAERLAEQVKRYIDEGHVWITIQDQLFTHGDDVMLAFVEELRRRNIRPQHLSLFVEPGCFGREVYDSLAQAGIEELVLSFGVETGSPKVARNLNRFDDYDRILSDFEYISQKPYYNSTWWMVGLPGEGPTEIDETKRFIVETMKLGAYARWVTPLILFPQTDLAKNSHRFGIKQILTSFNDFKRFSTTERNEYAVYPELITHESEMQSAADTLRYVKEIKQIIEDNYHLPERTNRGKINHTDFVSFRRGTFF